MNLNSFELGKTSFLACSLKSISVPNSILKIVPTGKLKWDLNSSRELNEALGKVSSED